MADTAIGIDVGEKYTRVVDASLKGGKVEVSALSEEQTVANFYSDDTEKSIELESELILKITKDLKIGKRNARVIIPDATSFHQVMEFSKLNQKELLSAVRYQADQFIPLPIDEVLFDIEIIRENPVTRKNTVLVVASPKKIVDRVEKAIELSGLIPESLETELSAISRFFSDVYQYNDPNPGSYLVINFGFTTTSLYLFAMPGGIITELRTVKTGYDLFIKELKFNLEFQDAKAIEVLSTIGFDVNATYDLATYAGPLIRDILNEMTKFVILAQDKHALPVKKIFLCNHESKLHSFDKKITELIHVPTESLLLRDLIVNNPISQTYANTMSSFTAAISANFR
jgi:type IV pilus assembly protein PilM